MDPLDPSSFNHRKATLSTGNTYHFVDQRPEHESPDTTTLLLVHGFPDFWYGWRHQIGPWVRSGFRVVVPDMLGYGETVDHPSDTKLYSTKHLSADLAALLDHLGIAKAVVIGHDWGSVTVWRFSLWYPERVRAAITLSVPFIPPQPVYIPPAEAALRIPKFGYQLYFSEERSTEAIEAQLPFFFNLVFRENTAPGDSWLRVGQLEEKLANIQSVTQYPSLLTPQEREYYLSNFKRSGMHGPLSYYRTTKIRFEEERDGKLPSTLSPDIPVLFFWGTEDGTCSPVHVERSRKFVPAIEIVVVEGKRHWLMVEAKNFITTKVMEWLKDISELDMPEFSKL